MTQQFVALSFLPESALAWAAEPTEPVTHAAIANRVGFVVRLHREQPEPIPMS